MSEIKKEEQSSWATQEKAVLPPSAPTANQALFQLLGQIRDAINKNTEVQERILQTITQSKPSTVQQQIQPTAGSKPVPVESLFPRDLANMLTFETSDTETLIRPKQFLGSENFAKIAAIVRDAGGEYISAGKESHFKISK